MKINQGLYLGNFHINRKALEHISTIKYTLSIICVAGPYRTGKSFLINKFARVQNGFSLGSTVNPCTKGIHQFSRGS